MVASKKRNMQFLHIAPQSSCSIFCNNCMNPCKIYTLPSAVAYRRSPRRSWGCCPWRHRPRQGQVESSARYRSKSGKSLQGAERHRQPKFWHGSKSRQGPRPTTARGGCL